MGVNTTSVAHAAVFPEQPWTATAASIVAIPFEPFTVSVANTMAMEAVYLQRAIGNSELRRDHLMHCTTAVTGLGLFALDEVRPGYPLCHAVWHGLSAASVAYTLPLMKHIERHPWDLHGQEWKSIG